MTLTKDQIIDFYRANEGTFDGLTSAYYDAVEKVLRDAYPGTGEEDLENLFELI